MTNSDTGTIEAICEAMKAIENADCSNDLVWALDKIPLKYAPEWGAQVPCRQQGSNPENAHHDR